MHLNKAGTILKYLSVLLLVSTSSLITNAQTNKFDSLLIVYKGTKVDTARVQLLWQMANEASSYNPDTALVLSFEAISIAEKKGYTEGKSKALGIMANTFMRIGNYPKALELNIEKLKLEEKRNVPQNLASVTMNIGIVYALQEEYKKALQYYKKADSIIQQYNVENLKYNIALNTGDVYDRLNIPDSAYKYFYRSLLLARNENDVDLVGTSMTGLGHTYRKMGNITESKLYYHQAIEHLKAAGDDEILCEATLGLAHLFRQISQSDSAHFYARYSLLTARNSFPSQELLAAEFLREHFRQMRNLDSAFSYVNLAEVLTDSIHSKENIRKSQVISSNEHLRQMEIAELKEREKKERSVQLQLLLIAVFIPLLFILSIYLSRIFLSAKLVKWLGIISLLFLFEFLTLFIHPTVANLTHHTPVYEILIFVAIAAFIIPLHHKLEHWAVHKLLHEREKHLAKLEIKKMRIKKPPQTKGGSKK